MVSGDKKKASLGRGPMGESKTWRPGFCPWELVGLSLKQKNVTPSRPTTCKGPVLCVDCFRLWWSNSLSWKLATGARKNVTRYSYGRPHLTKCPWVGLDSFCPQREREGVGFLLGPLLSAWTLELMWVPLAGMARVGTFRQFIVLLLLLSSTSVSSGPKCVNSAIWAGVILCQVSPL